MHKFVLGIGLLFTGVVACSGGATSPTSSRTEGALADKGGDNGGKGDGTNGGGSSSGSCGDPGKDGGKGDPPPGGGGECFSQSLDGCWDIGKAKEVASAKCDVPGLALVDFKIGPSCGASSALDITFTCCATPPPQVCKELPIPADICKDPMALKQYAIKICGDDSAGLSFPDGDPCGPKSAVECCVTAPPPPGTTPPPK